MSDVEVTDNPSESRFEARLDGELAGIAVYELHPDRIVFLHTEVDDAFEGRGVGSALARTALDDVRGRGGLAVVPRCPFIAGWIEKHPDYQDLVAAG
jgi:uncharacterized protein